MLFYDYGKMAYTANDDNVLKYPRNYRYRFIKRGDGIYKTNSFGEHLSLTKISYTKREMTEFSFRMFIEIIGELRLANGIDPWSEKLESIFPEPMEMDVGIEK